MAMTKCAECGKEVSNQAKLCPNCGVEIKKKASPLKVIGVISFCFFVVSLVVQKSGLSVPSVAYPTASYTPSTSSAASSYSSELTASNEKFKRGQYGVLTYTGEIINTTGKKLSYVQVEINLYDKNKGQIGSTLANVNNLEPGVTWSFEAPVIEERTKTAKVAGITFF
ncbi:FxLYD domain-containing protein [Pseudomonas sp. CCI1.2]|uniref:FxLYD domain-containing protein n=1 Tax=unclassified Pseudomonas TaxID=196821 RepID=UPI002AC93D1D|nr:MULTISPECIES: FxLYD domain-containing protein [unclassified Pseudomonas]MEB0092880.1 FxLYD domain-containing protein [Pseudomonas sp. CCI4.2]MEB0120516.1 FxLYD domain-containing protein [Pseudomonas sp. CCI1.2]WPX55469.1 FxLYD domain-containing protein [Pseudomonas sp. CCI4.2]